MILTIPEQCNYVEICIKKDQGSEDEINIGKDKFVKLMDCVKMSRFFKKHTKFYQHGLLTYENSFHEEVKVTSKTIKHVESPLPGIMVCYSNKEKQPYHMFPSTSRIDNCYYSKKLIFRFHNRVYLNFEAISDMHRISEAIYKVYINYNHDNNVDLESITQCIQSIMNMMHV